jgi:NAD(P)-dependent dehydrogenase (short-subunit alcohol dehydrogenase family)
MRFDGKVALITGAASGIGRASALAFAHEGARVAIADIDESEGIRTAQLAEKEGVESCFIKTDVSSSAQVRTMVDTAVAKFGRLDYAHNNAGIVGAGVNIADMEEDTWNRGINSMLTGVFFCMKYELPHMLEAKRTAIVNTSSGAGLIGFPGMANYVASKHGVLGLTKTAALEYAAQNVRINAVCPGTTRSRMVDEWMRGDTALEQEVSRLHPVNRIAEPEEIAAAVLWLCSDEASFMVGHALVVDGGYTIQ